MGEVVRDDLMLIELGDRDPTVLGRSLGEVTRSSIDKGARGVDGRAGGGMGVSHGGGAYRRVSRRIPSEAVESRAEGRLRTERKARRRGRDRSRRRAGRGGRARRRG